VPDSEGSLPSCYPFERLRLRDDERVRWFGSNPTFHRTADYGIVLTDLAVYLYPQLPWPITWWRRIPLTEVVGARFEDSRIAPCLRLLRQRGSRTLRTPPDGHSGEMQFDRRVLREAADRISAALPSAR
jgi:hypothetical protein